MALENVICRQDPFIYGYNDNNNNAAVGYGFGILGDEIPEPDCSAAHNTSSSSQENPPPVIGRSGSKRGRRKSMKKNKEEMENQRMTHITVERNRRRQMNEYLAILRSLMPPSYAQRGDQASIVGGAVNYVKELEQLVQFLEGHKAATQQSDTANYCNLLSKFFTFPQYTTSSMYATADIQPGIADIEVTMAESHSNIKLLMLKGRSTQLLKMINAFQSIYLTILHLSLTSMDRSVLYSFSVKVEDECQLTTVNEIANAVHEIVGMIQEESMSR